MDELNVGVIGVGLQGQIHAKSYSLLKEANLEAIADINEKKARKIAEKLDVPKMYKNYENMLEDPEIEAVSVATPDFLHRDPVIDSIEAEKHVLCEKPMATKIEDAEDMIKAWEKSDVKFMVCFENRWNPPFRDAKRKIENGDIGRPIYIYARLNAKRSVPLEMLSWSDKSSPVFFIAVHTLDLCRWFGESNVSVVDAHGCSGFLKERGADVLDSVQSLITLENDVECLMESNWILPESFPHGYDFEFGVYGSEGTLEVNTTHQTCSVTTDDSFIYPEIFRIMSVDDSPYGFVPGAVRHFVQSVLEDKAPMTSPLDGKAATEAALAILESIDKNKTVKLSE
ncbi:hypothetical protein AKJ63_00985 [candidate division MSBL1 archaeon SCGC-AAA259D18]|uniref:Oxidoreductase n=2 Tax=candidate division MSBL1 TaxID=215777 RepID=A0A133UBJ3_9EURY|nr:hypothetical protein AKJ57_00860 [candidate division MSBL1 archaeon SCGC-AAA259A05]KXA91772.1 hypothetical protein AKJ63_00985 [candidate division MSBL1 archaeon SCGC-AAA259D18]